MQIPWHFPEVLEREFNPKFRGMRWSGKRQHFDLCAARMRLAKGYPQPIVDHAEARDATFDIFAAHNHVRYKP